jgi:small-conductance mechanosensitive channel
MAVSFVILSLIIVWIWWWRRPISRSILEGDETTAPGAQPSRVRQLVAANWHVFATCFIAGIWMMSTLQRLLTKDPPTAPILISLCILFTVPVADAALRAAVAALLRSPQEEPTGAPPPAGSRTILPSRSRMAYRAVLVRNLRIVLLVIAVVVLARVWDVDMQSMAASGVGETVAGALLEITIILVLASAAWGIVKTAIANAAPERGQAEAEGEIGGKGLSRSETLLPLIGNFILVAIVVVTMLAVLSALGVAIGPLIAGAGVIGIAIGFGAQTLVRDVLSGIFFLIDDAFRTGEYIDTGGVRGMVEHISIRSLRLRHHRGPIHTIPFGEIQHLTNFSRDWAIEKLELRVPYDTDLEKVRKIIKAVGRELMEHPEHGPNFIQPLKSQGVNRMDDSAFIVRVKFMAKPGEQFVLRREVFRRIQQAFSDNGIHFAPRRVIVETATEAPDARAAAAALAAASEPEARRSGIS